MPVTRINNNQITDASTGNIYVGVNAAAKLQDYSITSGKIANNLTYDSSLTITGNLTVQGNTTTVDTHNLVVEDPLILLAKEQTGSPTLDIGFIGKRGTSDNIAWVWDESANTFVGVFTTSEVTNTVISISSYTGLTVANLTATTGNFTGNVQVANLSVVGNIFGSANFSGNVAAGNFLTTGLVSATGNVTGGNINTAGVVTATGNISGGNLRTAGFVSATGNVDAGNLRTAGVITATGNIDAGNLRTAGLVTATGNVDAGNLRTAGLISSTGTITSAANVIGANITTAGLITATGNVIGGNILTAGIMSSTGNAVHGNVLTSGVVTATGNVTGGNINTAGVVTATGNVTGGNINTAGIVSATGNINGLNVNTAQVASTGGITITSGGSSDITLAAGGNISAGTNYINNVIDPVQNQDAATKIYVDNKVTTAISYHDAVVAATTTTLATTTGGTITYAQPNGAGNGVGATITTTGSFNLIDTANVQTANTRILVKNEGNAVLNGVYVWSNATVITRATDADTYGPASATQLSINDYFFVSSGNVNKGSAWIVDEPAGTITFGTSNIAFAQFSSSQTYTANTSAGISLTGTVFSAKVDNDTTAFDGGGNISVKAGANLVTPNIGAATGTSLSLTGNVTGANLNTGGLITATGNIQGGNLRTTGLISATGTITSAANVTGGNITTAGLITATGNVTAGNVLTGGLVSATGTITSVANISGGNLLTGGLISATGNVTSGNINTAGVVTATGNVIGGNINTAGVVTATGNVIGGNLRTAGLITATGNVDAGNLRTAGLITATGNVQSGNVNTAGIVSATGNILGSNLILSSGIIDGPAAGRITINGSDIDTDFAVDGDTTANVFYVDAGTGTASFGNSSQTTNALVAFNSTNSIRLPVGNTTQRPNPAVAGMLRFNTTGTQIEWYDGTSWESPSANFTVITADSFTGNGSQTVYTLSSESTTAATIVAINGVVQIPTTAYAVSGNVLTFTEAPANVDVIDARILTTTTTVTELRNVSGNAIVEVLDSADTVQITGNLLPQANVTYNLGSNTLRWNNAYFNGTTIFLGNLQLKESPANTFSIFLADGTTQANIDVGAIDVSAITNGTSNIAIPSTNGNATISVGGTSNVLTVATTGTFVTGLSSVTGNITAGNIAATNHTGTTVSVTGNITGGNVLGGANVNATTHTGTTVSVTGNVTGSNLNLSGDIFDTGAISINTASNGNITLNPNGSGVIIANKDILNGQANGVGNIGNSAGYFNTIFAKATSAQYADLAEMYEADAIYEPGTVVCFGGAKEITMCSEEGSRRVAGVVSTNPSYIMNAGLAGEHVVAVALTGRVPTKVTGVIRKGDMLIATGDGRARSAQDPAVGSVIGKALAEFDGADGVIEVVVGRL